MAAERALSRALERLEAAETPRSAIRAIECALRLEGRTGASKMGRRSLLRGVLLTRLGRELTGLGGRGHQARLERAIGLLEKARQNLSSAFGRGERAKTLIALASALDERARGDRSENLERAISLYKLAIRNLDRKTDRYEWVQAHHNLGNCYFNRAKGLRESNLGRAIAAYDATLRARDRRLEPSNWARAKMNRAMALSMRRTGNYAAAQDEAIAGLHEALTVITRRRFPDDWATCQGNLGTLYQDRIIGDRAKNLELSIAAFQKALTVVSRRDAASDWVAIKHNLALALSDRLRGSRDENIEQALEVWREVMTVTTKRKSPVEWAGVQTMIAVMFLDRARGVRSENLERAIEAGERALSVLDPRTAPSGWAHAQTVTANAYGKRVKGDRQKNLETGIAMLQSVVSKVSRKSAPLDWAMAHLNLATKFSDRAAGSHAENLELSIHHSLKALAVFTKDTASADWAMIHANLACTFYRRVSGNRAKNLEKGLEANDKALSVFTAKDHFVDWSTARINRATALCDRIAGSRSENLELALSAVRAPLRLLDRKRTPEEYGAVHAVHASVMLDRVRGSPRQNIEAGIRSVRKAIEVYASHRMSFDWARALGILASLHLSRSAGERSDNVEHAIAACRDVLSVFRPDNDPMEWASTQTKLAVAFFERSRGSRADNIEHAIAACKAALTVYNRRDTHAEWSLTQRNLANIYAEREKGDLAQNAAIALAAAKKSLTILKKREDPYEWATGIISISTALQTIEEEHGAGFAGSIMALTDALTVLNRRDHPFYWAVAQTNLGNALGEPGADGAAPDFRRSISAYRQALTVFTRTRFPEQHLRATRLLGATHSASGQWRLADRAFAEARTTADLLMGLGLHPGEQSRILEEMARVGRLSALARIRCGDCLGALNLLEHSRSVELAVSLRLDTAGLSKDDTRRLHDLRRRARAAEEALQAPDLENPKALVQRLGALHAKICRLVAAGRAPDEEAARVERLLDDLLDENTCVLAPVITEHGSAGLVAQWGARGPVVSHVDIPLQARVLEAIPFASTRRAAGRTRSVRFASSIIGGDAIERAWMLFGQVLNDAGVAKESRVIVLTPGDAGSLTPALAARGSEAVLNDFEVTVAPSLALAQAAKRRAQAPRKASLGAVINPTLDLDGAVVEHAFVSAHFASERQQAAIGKAASAPAVAKIVQRKSHWLFATHGQFDRSNERNSWLALAGGQRLFMSDPLFSRRSRGPRLVVLSACESGLHEHRLRPEEFNGFAGLFLQMGAAGVIVAAWKVNDTATAFLMGRFFRHHVAEALSAATALRRAQLWLRGATVEALKSELGVVAQRANAVQKRAISACRRHLADCAPGTLPYSAPEHWAGFTLVGA